jgi:hypothetical protein
MEVSVSSQKYDNILFGYPKTFTGATLASKWMEAAWTRYMVHFDETSIAHHIIETEIYRSTPPVATL